MAGCTIDSNETSANGIGWVAEVNTFADLPAVADNTGKTYLVKTSTGLMITFNLKRAGFYYSDGVTWEKKGEVQQMFRDDELTFQDDADNSKQIGFQLSSIGTGIRRIFTWPNKNGTVAMLSDIVAGEVKFVDINVTSGIISGSATSGFLASTNKWIEYQIQGSGGGVSKIVYYGLIVPTNFTGSNEIKLDTWTTDFAGLTTWTITIYINGVIDSTINAIDITPTANTTYQTKINTIGDSLSAGDKVMIQLNFTGSNADDIRFRRLTLE